MTGVIEFTAEKNKRYEAEKKIDPADLLPILQTWKDHDPEKYSITAAMICSSAGISPEEIKRHSQSQAQQPTEKIIDLDKYYFYRQVDPADLLQIFAMWKTAEPEKFCTMTAMICSSANVKPEDLAQKNNYRGRNHDIIL